MNPVGPHNSPNPYLSPNPHQGPYQNPGHQGGHLGQLAPGQLAPGQVANEYEFDAAQNEQLRKAATHMGRWGVASILIGVIFLLAGGFGLLTLTVLVGLFKGTTLGAGGVALGVVFTGIAYGIVLMVAGRSYGKAAAQLNAVVNTAGSDVSHLVRAVGAATLAMRLEAVMLVIATVVVVVASFFGVRVMGVS